MARGSPRRNSPTGEDVEAVLNRVRRGNEKLTDVANDRNLTEAAARRALRRTLDDGDFRLIREQHNLDGMSVQAIADYWQLSHRQVRGILDESERHTRSGS